MELCSDADRVSCARRWLTPTEPETVIRAHDAAYTDPLDRTCATLPASPLNSFANGECLAQRRLPTRAELFGDFGVRHEDIESVEGATHNQEFGCDAGVDEPARVLHVFFGEQVDSTDTDPGRRQAGDAGYPRGYGCCRHLGRTR